MRVLLINPPVPNQKNWVREGRCQQMDIWGAPFPPLSLALVAGQIKSAAQTLIVDSGPAGLNLEETLEKIKNHSPNLLILATATPTINTDLDWFLTEVKRLKPETKTAAIGIHVTELSRETLENFPCLDFAIRGEPELVIKDLVSFLKDGKPNLEEITGLSFRQSGKIIVNPARDFIADLDELEFPFWQGVDFNNYKLPVLGAPFNLITFARGCPFNCKFCNASVYYGKKIRKRSPQKIIEEIEMNIRDFSVKDFLFWTEFVTIDKDYLRQFLSLIKAKGLQNKIRWVSNSRASGIDLALFREMREAGCWQIAFGLEFGSDEILALAQKGPDATVENHRQTIMAADKAGIAVDGHFIMGYPGETPKTLQATIDFACSLPLTFAHFYVATPFPGSQLYREAIEKKWIENPDWKTVRQDVPNLRTPQLSVKTIKQYVSRAYREFYLRPKTVFKISKIAKTPAEFILLIKTGLRFIFDILKHESN